MSGPKTGMENGMFWSEIGSGLGEPSGTPQPRNARSTVGGCNKTFLRGLHYKFENAINSNSFTKLLLNFKFEKRKYAFYQA